MHVHRLKGFVNIIAVIVQGLGLHATNYAYMYIYYVRYRSAFTYDWPWR